MLGSGSNDRGYNRVTSLGIRRRVKSRRRGRTKPDVARPFVILIEPQRALTAAYPTLNVIMLSKTDDRYFRRNILITTID